MISRDVIHIPTAGVSIMVSMRGTQATIVFAFCNPRDSFSKKFANQLLDARLEAGRNLIRLSYIGRKPRKDILFPIADFVREELGFIFCSEQGRYLHPYTFADAIDGDVEIFEPTTPVVRSVTRLMEGTLRFIEGDLRPRLEAPFERIPQVEQLAVAAV